MKGFSLIEILISIAIISVIIGFSSFFHSKFSRSSFIIDESASFVVNVLNIAKQKAMIGEENDNWGVWLINTSTNDYFYLFKGTTSTLKQRFELPSQISFFDFTDKTIIFQKITGNTTSTTIKIGFSSNFYKTIKVSTSGAIWIE